MPPVASEPKAAAPARVLPNPTLRPANGQDNGSSAPFAELIDNAPAPRSERTAERPQTSRPRRNDAASADHRRNVQSKSDSKPAAKPTDNTAAKSKDKSKEKDDSKDTGETAKSTDNASETNAADEAVAIKKPASDEIFVESEPAPVVQSAEVALIAPVAPVAASAIDAAPEQPAIEITPADLAAKPAQPGAENAPADIAAAAAEAPDAELRKELSGTRSADTGKGAATNEKPEHAAIARPATPIPAHGEEKSSADANGESKDAPKAAQAEANEAPAKGEHRAARGERAAEPGAPQANTARAADPAQPSNFTLPVSHTAAAAAVNHAPAAPATPAVAVPVEGIAVEIAARAQAGRNRFEIRLDPPELGRIDVRLDVERDGRVTSRLVVERAETLDLLRRDAPQLERALQDAGLKTADNALQFSLRQQSEGRDEPANAGRDTAQLIVNDELSLPEIMQRGYSRLAELRGGIDIRV